MQTSQPIIQIHPAQATAEVDALVEALSQAFDQDPHINWIVRQDSQRSAAFRQLFRLLLTDLGGKGEIFSTTDLKAAAIWFPPAAWRLNLLTQIKVGLRFGAISGWKNLAVRAYGLNLMEAKHPKEPHYFLQTIGVDPTVQGLGYGAALLQPLLTRCDESSTPAYLETSNQANIPFYEKHGFKVISNTSLPQGPVLFQMLRPSPINKAPVGLC